eukprot:comp24157_c1_seq1/m.44006 comp24157_c1_seq1/g.44006  ORF comp24157_c1_seq1/g.44006 comp24157_c1_seq1/m.44006 type:complete len:418 (-) comp24157_c1_seq1:378-1631(-)
MRMARGLFSPAVLAQARVAFQRNLAASSQQQGYATTLSLSSRQFLSAARNPHSHTALLRPAACGVLLSTRQFSSSSARFSPPATDPTPVVDAVTAASQPLTDAATAVAQSGAAEFLGRAMQKGDLAALGLANNWPPGLLQQLMETMCVEFSMPWWQAIVGVTIGIRLLILPIALKAMRNNMILSNIKPEMDEIQARMKECFDRKDHAAGQKEVLKLQAMFTQHNVHPAKSLIMPVVQMPLFISFFLAIKRMAELPVESMKTGGLLWVTDLTIPDPYYILPVASGLSMLASLELGTEGVSNQQQTVVMRNAFRIMSIVFIPVMASFPSALLMYWTTNNIFSLSQLAILRIPAIKKALNIPTRRVTSAQANKPQPGFIEGFKMAVNAGAPPPPQAPQKPAGYPSNYVGFKPKGKGAQRQ